jgi:hypothetical protein
MSVSPHRRSVQELGLENGDELKLYLELIRIIEKDIDDTKADNTRSGWTSWAIVGGIAAALSMLLSETRKLEVLPWRDIGEMVLAGLLFNALIASLRVLYRKQTGVRPGRIRWSNDEYFAFLPSAIYNLLIIFAAITTAVVLPLTVLIKSIVIAASTLWALLTSLLLVLCLTKFPFGNNRISRKSGVVISLTTLLFSALAFALLILRMEIPVGEAATLPYVLAGLILALIVLSGNLIYRMAPSRLLSNLEGLRNDIIFLRVEIDEALRRYEILKEGETLPDALQKDLSEIVNDLNVIDYAHSNMRTLIQRLIHQTPLNIDSQEVKEQKLKQFNLDTESYALHESKCNELLQALGKKLNALSKKQIQLASITEDWTSENAIRSGLAQRVKQIEEMNSQLNESIRRVIYYSNNPDNIPQELRATVDSKMPEEKEIK